MSFDFIFWNVAMLKKFCFVPKTWIFDLRAGTSFFSAVCFVLMIFNKFVAVTLGNQKLPNKNLIEENKKIKFEAKNYRKLNGLLIITSDYLEIIELDSI